MFDISFVIPVYNADRYVDDCINSVRDWENGNYQIVLVNDGSTDKSARICEEYAKSYDRVKLINQCNKGVSVARNTGIECAYKESKYIAFLDADDKLDYKWREGLENILQQGYDIIQFQSQLCNERMKKGKVYPLESTELVGGDKNIWAGSNQHFGARLYSSKLFYNDKVRFVPGLKYSEDKIFLMTTNLYAERIVCVSHVMYLYRSASDSVMQRRKYGLEYYEPIIDAYIDFDNNSIGFEKSINHGKLAASVYIMEAVKEHLEFGGKIQDAEKFLKKYKYVMTDTGMPENREFINYTNNTTSFVLKYRIRGYGKRSVKAVKRAIDKVRI